MTGSSSTPMLWACGSGRLTGETKNFSEDVLEHVRSKERRSVYGHFFKDDGSRGCKRVAVFERPEDAKLGAAAPDLLEAVYAALPFVEDALNDPAYKTGAVKKYVDMLKKAIAKAEGEAVA